MAFNQMSTFGLILKLNLALICLTAPDPENIELFSNPADVSCLVYTCRNYVFGYGKEHC